MNEQVEIQKRNYTQEAYEFIRRHPQLSMTTGTGITSFLLDLLLAQGQHAIGLTVGGPALAGILLTARAASVPG